MSEIIKTMPRWHRFNAVSINGKTYRCMKEDDDSIFVFAPRSKKHGWRYTLSKFTTAFDVIPDKDPTEEWHKRLQRAIKILDKSGLWKELRTMFENCLEMTWEDRQTLRNLDLRRYSKDDADAIYRSYQEKYPFVFYETSDGHLNLDYNYLFELSECRLKSMYFGKYWNKQIKASLKKAIEDNVDYPLRQVRAGYDVSVSFNAEKKEAYYSEEYKDCGNGHYYLMLDENTAVFLEDD